jgi:hypothetical protein
MPEPGNANSITHCKTPVTIAQASHTSDNLVSGNERKLGVRQVAVDHVEIGAANRARRDFDKHLAGTGTRHPPLNQPERMASSLEHHRLHASTFLMQSAFINNRDGPRRD